MASAALVGVGVISYPLYLWHWPLLSFAAILGGGTPDDAYRVVAVVASFVLAWATFALFERPIRAQKGVRVIAALLAALAILGAAGLIMFAARGFPQRFETDVRAMIPEPKRDQLCPKEFGKHRVFNYCKSTQPVPPAAIFLGDSRTQAIYDGVVSAVGNRYPLALLARGGCPAVLGVNLHYVAQGGCKEAWDIFVKYVQKVKPRVVVVVGGGADLLRMPDAEMTTTTQHFESRRAAFKFGLRELIKALQTTSQVIYVRQIPKFKSSPNCFLRPITLPESQCAPRIALSTIEERTATYNDIVDEVQRELPALRVLDPTEALCGPQSCSQTLPSGEIIYSDRLHLSTAGGRHFARESGLLSLIERELTY